MVDAMSLLAGLAPWTLALLGAANTNVPGPSAPEPVRIQKAALTEILTDELGERGRLDDFQVLTSKFSDGRVVLRDIDISAGPREGTARVEAHADLSFARKQLGVEWRGLRSRKKWFVKGRKRAARVRLRCVVSLEPTKEGRGIVVRATAIRVKLVSNLSPLRGVVARFDMKDRAFRWDMRGRDAGGLEGWLPRVRFDEFRIAEITQDELHVIVRLSFDRDPKTPSIATSTLQEP